VLRDCEAKFAMPRVQRKKRWPGLNQGIFYWLLRRAYHGMGWNMHLM